jgi:hypothetical protein
MLCRVDQLGLVIAIRLNRALGLAWGDGQGRCVNLLGFLSITGVSSLDDGIRDHRLRSWCVTTVILLLSIGSALRSVARLLEENPANCADRFGLLVCLLIGSTLCGVCI